MDGITLLVSLTIGWLFLIVLLLTVLLGGSTRRQLQGRIDAFGERRRISDAATPGFSQRAGKLQGVRTWLGENLSFLESDQINQKLMSANWNLTGTEFFLIRYGGALLSFFVLGLLIFKSFIVGFGFAILFFMLPELLVSRSIQERSLKFENQLLDVLVLVRGAVRAGYSLLQALDVVIKELPPPAAQEFARVKAEVGLGLSLGQALENLTLRRPNEDLKLVVTAIQINVQVGGNLSQMLDAVITTLRDRVRILGEVRALTSYARYSSYLLSFLPFGVVAALFILNPTYISRIFEPGPYLVIPIGALVMIVIGNIWIRRAGTIHV